MNIAQNNKHKHPRPAAHQPGHPPRRALTGLLCALLALQRMLAQAAPVLAQPATLKAGGALILASWAVGLALVYLAAHRGELN